MVKNENRIQVPKMSLNAAAEVMIGKLVEYFKYLCWDDYATKKKNHLT